MVSRIDYDDDYEDYDNDNDRTMIMMVMMMKSIMKHGGFDDKELKVIIWMIHMVDQ